MPTYLLLARKAVIAMPRTSFPIAIIVRLAAPHMRRIDVRCERVARREPLTAAPPVADMRLRRGAVVLGRGRQRARGGRVARRIVLWICR